MRLTALPFLFFALNGVFAFLDELTINDKLQLTTSTVATQTITCKFLPSEHPTFDKLLSLKLSRTSAPGATDTKLLVTVSPTDLKQADDFLGKATGQVVNDGSSESELVVEYVEPNIEPGVYTCQAQGLDSSVQVVESKRSVVIGSTESGEASPRQRLTDLNKSLIEFGVPAVDLFQIQRDLTVIKYFRDSKEIFGVTNVFNSKSFYLITNSFMHPEEAEQICKDNNGYMAEINTEEEFLFINASLSLIVQTKQFQPFMTVVTGVKLNEKTNEYECTTHPEDPVFLGNWAPGEPDKDVATPYIMLVDLIRVASYKMGDGTNERFDGSSYMCEVTISNDKQ